MSRVLIADDHAVVRAGYRQYLETEPVVSEIGEASSGNDTLDKLRLGDWDLLLMDLHMPNRSGLDVLGRVVAGYPDVRVLIMSGLPEEQYARNVLRAGASGYLSKGGTREEFLHAVRTVLLGRRYVSAQLAESMAADLESPRDHEAIHTQLSNREFQIFCKLASGMSVSRIAAELSLSVKTVSTYRTRVLEKMHFSSNADLTSYSLRTGLMQ
jgi:two-component system, NarL family, invasion response regulator UvrY